MTFNRNRYGGDQDIIEVPEEEFVDKVTQSKMCCIECSHVFSYRLGRSTFTLWGHFMTATSSKLTSSPTIVNADSFYRMSRTENMLSLWCFNDENQKFENVVHVDVTDTHKVHRQLIMYFQLRQSQQNTQIIDCLAA